MRLVRARFDTPHWHFEAYAPTRAEVHALLSGAWTIHCAQTGAVPGYLQEHVQDIDYLVIDAPAVFRDGEQMLLKGVQHA